MAQVKVDISALKELEQELSEMKKIALGRLGERGFQLLRLEIKNTAYITGNLWQGVSPPKVEKNSVTLTVTARAARRGARQGTLHLKSGKTKPITLRANPEFNYAAAVALGRPAIRAKEAKVLLIPVKSRPANESYITADGQIYIMRPSAKAVRANPYHERAAAKLQSEAPRIIEAIVAEFN